MKLQSTDAEMTLLCILALATLLASLIYFHAKRNTSDTRQSIDLDKCRLIITGTKHPNGIPNQISPLSSRALPNQRLRIAFGIKNAFTSVDEIYTRRFVHHAKDLVNMSSADWSELSGILREAVKVWTGGQTRIKLTSMIQALSLRVILLVFFGLKKDIADGHLINLAQAINRVWIETKSADSTPRFAENIQLQECLSAIFANRCFTAEESPLNVILPGFETLWRVVFRMFLETGFTTGQRHPGWGDMLVAFSDTPTKRQFVQTDQSHVSPETLVNEALRLYPPTRRVYRAFKLAHDEIETLAADLEGCHTALHIWGRDAMIYNPDRWTRLTSQQKQAFLPFGSAPFVCPAKPVFGPRVIALLVGALLRGLGDDWRVELDVELEGRLSNERGAYDAMHLVETA